MNNFLEYITVYLLDFIEEILVMTNFHFLTSEFK